MGEGNIENAQIQVLSMSTKSLGSLPLPSVEPPGNVAGDAVDHIVTVNRYTSLDFNISDRSEEKKLTKIKN